MTYLESILKVLVVGLVLGAGLPALFATGLMAFSRGESADGTATRSAVGRVVGIALFVFVGWVIVTAVAWITRATIIHHTGVDLFPFLPLK
ncbi:hypothetical protein [Mycolicibacterium phlei]|jgi:hypothetical protein